MEKKVPTRRFILGKNGGKFPQSPTIVKVSTISEPSSLAEKLEAFDPVKHGGEYMSAKPVGQEVIPR